jgi:hypothetical protein
MGISLRVEAWNTQKYPVKGLGTHLQPSHRPETLVMQIVEHYDRQPDLWLEEHWRPHRPTLYTKAGLNPHLANRERKG